MFPTDFDTDDHTRLWEHLNRLGQAGNDMIKPWTPLTGLTPASGFTITRARYACHFPICVIDIKLSYTGSIDVSAGGNVSPDVTMFTGVPTWLQPSGITEGVHLDGYKPGVLAFTWRIQSGTAAIVAGASNGTINGDLLLSDSLVMSDLP